MKLTLGTLELLMVTGPPLGLRLPVRERIGVQLRVGVALPEVAQLDALRSAKTSIEDALVPIMTGIVQLMGWMKPKNS